MYIYYIFLIALVKIVYLMRTYNTKILFIITYKMNSLAEYQETFNKAVLEFASNISQVCPNSIIANNISVIRTMISQYPQKFMGLFIQHVLKYKNQIDTGDDAFFMNKDFNDDVQGDSSAIQKVFAFKSIWETLSPQNKNVVKQHMQFLCFLAQEYFMKCYQNSNN